MQMSLKAAAVPQLSTGLSMADLTIEIERLQFENERLRLAAQEAERAFGKHVEIGEDPYTQMALGDSGSFSQTGRSNSSDHRKTKRIRPPGTEGGSRSASPSVEVAMARRAGLDSRLESVLQRQKTKRASTSSVKYVSMENGHSYIVMNSGKHGLRPLHAEIEEKEYETVDSIPNLAGRIREHEAVSDGKEGYSGYSKLEAYSSMSLPKDGSEAFKVPETMWEDLVRESAPHNVDEEGGGPVENPYDYADSDTSSIAEDVLAAEEAAAAGFEDDPFDTAAERRRSRDAVAAGAGTSSSSSSPATRSAKNSSGTLLRPPPGYARPPSYHRPPSYNGGEGVNE